jgi:hypothetical protein
MKKIELGIITFVLGFFLILNGKFIMDRLEMMKNALSEQEKRSYYQDTVSGILVLLVLLAFFLNYLIKLLKPKKKSFGFKFY